MSAWGIERGWKSQISRVFRSVRDGNSPREPLAPARELNPRVRAAPCPAALGVTHREPPQLIGSEKIPQNAIITNQNSQSGGMGRLSTATALSCVDSQVCSKGSAGANSLALQKLPLKLFPYKYMLLKMIFF